MKRFHYWGALVLCLMLNGVYSQAPQSFKYQSVARNSGGEPIANDNIGLRISIRDLSATGTIVYQETHVVTTNAFGLFSISVGEGTGVSGTFSSIPWGSGSKFLEVEADFSGGTNYTSLGASQLLSVPYALYAASGTQGPQGLPGTQGPPGAQGLTGSNGTNGSNGLNILNGTTNPTAGVGVNGEFYINTTTSALFGPKTGGVWPAGVSLIGATGTSGINGTNGLNVLNGTNNPTAGVGVNGEFYINTVTNTLFGPKTSAGWPPIGVSLVGPTGSPGAAGASGTNGTNGLNILNGTTNPTGAIGVNGEFYINTATSTLFGPKTGGAWPVGVSLVGSAANAWNIAGNAGLIDGSNFIGTTDNIPLTVRVNNQTAGRIDPAGPTFFGYQAGRINVDINNSGFGHTALSANTNGSWNTAFGFQTLSANTIGNWNTAIGAQALNVNITGYANTATGLRTLYTNTTGYYNTANGVNALYYNNGNYNTAIGAYSLYSNTTGASNTALGFNTLYYNTTAVGNTGVGYEALYVNNGFYNTALGWHALYSNTNAGQNTAIGHAAMAATTTGFNNTALGRLSLNKNTTGSRNIALGMQALENNTTGTHNVAVGEIALFTSNGSENTAVGHSSMSGNTSGNLNTGVGRSALASNTTGNNNTAFGYQAGSVNTTGSNNTFLGYNASPSSSSLTNATAIGYQASVSTSNSLVLGGTGANAVNVGIGITAPTAKLDIAGSVKIVDGTQGAGKVLTSDENGLAVWSAPAPGNGWGLSGNAGTINGTNFIGTTDAQPFDIRTNNLLRVRFTTKGQLEVLNTGYSLFMGEGAGANDDLNNRSNVFLGYWAGLGNTTGTSNVAVGTESFRSNTIGNNNVAVGMRSLNNNTSGFQNIAIGTQSLYTNTIGNDNLAFGYFALISNTTGNNNIASGTGSLHYNTTGSNNVATGFFSNYFNTSGNNNTTVGHHAGITSTFVNANTTGSNNTFIGYNSGPGTSTQLTNATAIGNEALVTSDNSLVLGGAGVNAVNVGIGVTAPTAKLDVAGSIKIVDGTQGAGKVLTSDMNGLAIWSTPAPGNGWGLSGNAGTDETVNFIGTTDNKALVFKVANTQAGRINPFWSCFHWT